MDTMIFGLVKLVIGLVGIVTISYFALPYFGYQLNLNYFRESRERCEERLKVCQKELIQGGLSGVKDHCDWKCADPKLFIQAEKEESLNDER